jgi:hypothetical protein
MLAAALTSFIGIVLKKFWKFLFLGQDNVDQLFNSHNSRPLPPNMLILREDRAEAGHYGSLGWYWPSGSCNIKETKFSKMFMVTNRTSTTRVTNEFSKGHNFCLLPPNVLIVREHEAEAVDHACLVWQ